MKDIMVDIETYGMPPNGALLQIGACAFERDRIQAAEELVVDSFLVSVNRGFYANLADHTDWCVDEKTVAWWEMQSEEARASLDMEVVSSPRAALQKFAEWLKAHGFEKAHMNSPNVAQIWANPPTFDLAILNHGYDVCNIPRPWSFRQEKDARTAFWLAYNGPSYKELKEELEGLVSHRGDHDAIRQAICLQHTFARVPSLAEPRGVQA
jgi:hypothetical protein